MTPEIAQLLQGIQQVIRDSVFTATIISGVLAASISSIFIFINGWMERSATSKRHIATLEHERRRQAQSLAVQLTVEDWKIRCEEARKAHEEKCDKSRDSGFVDRPDFDIPLLERTVSKMLKITSEIGK